MVHNMTPCKRSQNLPSLLREEGIFFPRIPCCQFDGFMGSPNLVFIVLMMSMEKFHALSPKSMCNGFQHVSTTHMTFVVNINNESNSPHIDRHNFIPNWPNKCSFLMGAGFVPHIAPLQFEVRRENVVPFGTDGFGGRFPSWSIAQKVLS
jgi:hypothetical protein